MTPVLRVGNYKCKTSLVFYLLSGWCVAVLIPPLLHYPYLPPHSTKTNRFSMFSALFQFQFRLETSCVSSSPSLTLVKVPTGFFFTFPDVDTLRRPISLVFDRGYQDCTVYLKPLRTSVQSTGRSQSKPNDFKIHRSLCQSSHDYFQCTEVTLPA